MASVDKFSGGADPISVPASPEQTDVSRLKNPLITLMSPASGSPHGRHRRTDERCRAAMAESHEMDALPVEDALEALLAEENWSRPTRPTSWKNAERG